MNVKFFLDTNIFIYSFDGTQPGKRERALNLINQALQEQQGVVSTQVIQEFLNVAIRKFAVPLKIEDCKVYLSKVLLPLCQIYPDAALYESALDIHQQSAYSFYDSLILAAAIRSNADVLYSEDLQSGQQISKIKIINPFN